MTPEPPIPSDSREAAPVPQGSGVPTLADAVREGLAPREARRLALRASAAVAAFHAAGSVHGRVTPRAFELAPDGSVALSPDAPLEATSYRLRYEAPEVVRREEPTRASDVFSLALVIRELIEGIPARRSTGDDLALEAIDGRVSAPHGLAGELQAVCVLASGVHAAERPRASEIVAALQGSARSRGPARTEWLVGGAAAVAAIALVFSLRTTADARERSNVQLFEGRAAVEGFVTNTYGELDRIPDITRLARAGEHALASVERIPVSDRSAEQRRLHAETLLWNAKANRVQGEVDAAEALFERALAGAAALEAGAARARIEMRAHGELARFARGRGDNGAANGHLRAIVDADLATLEVDGPDPELRLLRARAFLELGDLAMSMQTFDAKSTGELFDRARSAVGAVAEANAGGDLRDELELRSELNRVEANQAFLARDPDRGVELLSRHVHLARRLVELDPGVPRKRQLYARGADLLGRARLERADITGAAGAFRDAAEGWRLLREMQPGDVRWRREWARSSARLAGALGMVGEWKEAVTLHEASLGELSALWKEKRLQKTAALGLARLALVAAEQCHAAGDLARARERLRTVEPLLNSMPSTKRTQGAIRVERVRLAVAGAEVLLAEGSWKPAVEIARFVRTTIDSMAAKGEQGPVREHEARALLVCAAVRATEGDAEGARSLRGQALAIAEELERETPGEARILSLLARAQYVLGRDEEAAATAERLEGLGYRGLELQAIRAAGAFRRSKR